ncbi:N-acetylmuramoyl-L-alanine amidase [Micromonospora peucetia]|uniref:N-acetylmuramoyl-L-alanine amidase n=1 Tax=Micromonospora peucetia TaxID=47871 RepID=A0ABZ1EDE4_9ACTN|nr:N-acetylmuramoyl-L-alanine amidase [Micromonospora peucetia]WSA32130.1 N-acetylmuramoyl-L-alanine amidase [Micromonospora peucetia]
MRSTRLSWRGGAAAVLAVALLSPVAPATAATAGSTSPLDTAFTRAAGEFDVPKDVLVAVGYGETRLDGHEGRPSQANGYGVMHLVSNPRQRSLERAAELTGQPVAALKSVTSVNIRGGAALLRDIADAERLTAADRDRISAWYPVVARYAHAVDDATARLYADHVYDLLRAGITATSVRVAPQRVQPELGRYAGVSPAGAAAPGALAAAVPEYAPARWVAAYGGNYAAGRSSRITTVVVHVTQGSYAGTVSWFQNPSAGVSAHYVVKSSNGEVTQMVREGDTAYHARSANPYSVGIEHEGFVDNPGWFTDAMYRSSAALTRYLCDKYGLPKNRTAIKGHHEMPGNDHTDPGPHWNWNYYISLVNAGGGSGGRYLAGSPTDFTGDGRDDVIAFTQGSLNDVYVSTSTGASFAGTSVKWNDFFGLNGETLLTGDFNGDNRDDIIAFTHGTLADVYVSLSTGTNFTPSTKWHDWFAPGTEIAAVGDVNGDGKDDIITFTHDNAADVYVALSTGTSFTGTAVKWHEYFSITGEYPALGDVNGDGRDDIITFTQGPATASDVIVALSTGSSFGAPQKWHDLFAVGTEQPRVGDINGDGKDDIVTFTCDTNADVYAAVSTGTSFAGTTVKWNDFFCLNGEFPYLADVNGDNKDDIIVFTKGTTNDIYVGLSTGTTFTNSTKWHDYFGLNGETTL